MSKKSMILPNLLIIAGTGNKSGKTTMACHLTRQFKQLKIVSVKITPHFHETTPGLVLISEGKGYAVYEETNEDLSKDTSRMLKAGASRVFLAKVTDESLLNAFEDFYKRIPPDVPVICESPALRRFVEPGLLIIMISSEKDNQKDVKHLIKLPHAEFSLDSLSGKEELPVSFNSGKWSSWQQVY